MKNVTCVNHPLVQHKMAILRDKTTGTKQFQELVEELSMLIAYEAFSDLPLKPVTVETPLELCKAHKVDEDAVAIIPILRAGLGMVNGVSALLPTARVGFIGMFRDHETLQPCQYYCKLPKECLHGGTAIILDPMLATGGTCAAAIDLVKAQNPACIKLMCIIAAPEGIERVSSQHPNVQIYCAAIDRQLSDIGYILPGLGDAGDRLFGTK